MFYVYVYKDPRPGKLQQVFYVGKGTGNRAWAHWKKRVHNNKGFGALLAKLRHQKLEPVIELVAKFGDEALAFVEEMRLIAQYGRRDLKTGTLFNLTDGGEGYGTGILHTEEWSAKISAALSTPAQVSRNSGAAFERWAKPEYREKVTAAIRLALKDPEVIKRREAGKAAFVHTEEFRQTMVAAATKMWQDPAYQEKVVAAQQAAAKRPDVYAKKSAAVKQGWANEDTRKKRVDGIKASRTPELKAQISASCTALWDDKRREEQSQKMKAVLQDPERKAQRAAALKARWADPTQRAAILASRTKRLTPPQEV